METPQSEIELEMRGANNENTNETINETINEYNNRNNENQSEEYNENNETTESDIIDNNNNEREVVDFDSTNFYVPQDLTSSATSSTPNSMKPRRSPGVRKFHEFLDNPKSSKPALYYAVAMLLIILASTIAFLISSLPRYYNDKVFTTMQIVAGSIFTLDYILRLITADCWYRWAMFPLSIVDLFIVVPFILNLVPSINVDKQFIALRAVRLLYILKIIKITRYVQMTRVVVTAFKKSKDGFVVLALGLAVMCLFYSTLMFIAENTGEHFNETNKTWYRDDGTKSDFQSIFDGMWWCIVTFTTVGYGDMYPVTTPGKIVAALAMLTGLLLTALPVAIFTANFTELWRERKQKQRVASIKSIVRPLEGLSRSQKKESLNRLLKAILKKEKDMQLCIQQANDSLLQATQSHKQLLILSAILRERLRFIGEDEDEDDEGETPDASMEG